MLYHGTLVNSCPASAGICQVVSYTRLSPVFEGSRVRLCFCVVVLVVFCQFVNIDCSLATLPCWLNTFLLLLLLLLSYYSELYYGRFVDAYYVVDRKAPFCELHRALFACYLCCLLLFELKRADCLCFKRSSEQICCLQFKRTRCLFICLLVRLPALFPASLLSL